MPDQVPEPVQVTPEEIAAKQKLADEIEAEIKDLDYVPQKYVEQLEQVQAGLASLQERIDSGEEEITPETPEEVTALSAESAGIGAAAARWFKRIW